MRKRCSSSNVRPPPRERRGEKEEDPQIKQKPFSLFPFPFSLFPFPFSLFPFSFPFFLSLFPFPFHQWLNILQSVQLPFTLLPVLHLTSSPRIMGDFANRGWINYTCWILAALVIGINIYLVENFISDPKSPTPHEGWFYALVGITCILYIAFIFVVISDDIRLAWSKIKNLFGYDNDASAVNLASRAFRGNASNGRRGSGLKAADYSVMDS